MLIERARFLAGVFEFCQEGQAKCPSALSTLELASDRPLHVLSRTLADSQRIS